MWAGGREAAVVDVDDGLLDRMAELCAWLNIGFDDANVIPDFISDGFVTSESSISFLKVVGERLGWERCGEDGDSLVEPKETVLEGIVLGLA
jgi:hypothetical protein